MTDQIPLKRRGDALGQFEAGDATPIAFGGTGANDAAGARQNLGAITQAQANSGADSRIAAQKGQPNGLADLDADGKLPRGRLPAIATTETFVVASEAEMLALDAQDGDVAVRTDLGRTFILVTEPASTLANWQQIITPASPVQSVNGQTGPVVLEAADVGAATAAQGALADTAVQPGDLATVATSGQYSDLAGRPTLGSAAAANATDFATAAQGAKADSAVQPGQLSAVATSGNYLDLNNRPTLGTMASRNSEDFATAAQGEKADTAVQPGQLATVATSGSYNDLSNRPTIPSQPSDIGAQPSDALLSAIAALSTAADQIIVAAGSDEVAMFQLGATGKSVMAATSPGTARSSIQAVGLVGNESISGTKTFQGTAAGNTPVVLTTPGATLLALKRVGRAGNFGNSAVEYSMEFTNGNVATIYFGLTANNFIPAFAVGSSPALTDDATTFFRASNSEFRVLSPILNAPAATINGPLLIQTGAGLRQAGLIDNPPNIQNTSYTFGLADRGMCVQKDTPGGGDYTIPPDASVPMPIGARIGIAVTDPAGSVTIQPAAGVTLYLAGSRSTTGARTLSPGALAELRKVSTNLWCIGGPGVS
ncbi:hypothetical protein ABE488_00655 [Luteimonas sp. TWI662]|uniref:hypothetical protein n=1 Tax=Luteimonas sp. TWI662 TaxID=3136789 RepID=UPI00320B7E9E